MAAPMGMCLIKREGRARGPMPLLLAKVRSDNRGPEGAANESTQAWEQERERDVTEPSHSFQQRSWRNELCCETVDGEGGKA